MSFKSDGIFQLFQNNFFPSSENTRKVFEKFRDIWTGLTQSRPLHTHAADSALAQGESVLTLLHESPKQNCIGGCQCPPRLRSCSTTLSKEWNDLTSDYFFFTILCVLSLRYIQEQVSKMGINTHNRDQVHVSVKKKSSFPIWPKEISLFLPFAKDYLQFRISFTFAVRKISRKYLHYITKCTLSEHFLRVTHNCQDRSKTERKHRARTQT